MLSKSVADQIMGFVTSPYIYAALIAYIGGQILKILIRWMRTGSLLAHGAFASGDMPSTHTATVVAVATVVGYVSGFNSPVFALAFLLAVIVAYDACHVRRAVGEQGMVMIELVKNSGERKKLLSTVNADLINRRESGAVSASRKGQQVLPYNAKGHLLTEVIAGALFGLIVGVAVCILWGLI